MILKAPTANNPVRRTESGLRKHPEKVQTPIIVEKRVDQLIGSVGSIGPEETPKRQRTGAVQNAVAQKLVPNIPAGFGLRLSSGALIFAIGIVTTVLFLLVATVSAQETNAVRPVLKRTNTATATPPLPLPAKSPVDFFRELLAMNLAERNQVLSDRPPEARKQIMAKVREYESMNRDARELKLRATELRWYLLPLMRTPATNRTTQLGMMPAEIRPLVESRLQHWDLLPPDIQKEFLSREAAILVFTTVGAGTNSLGTNRVVELGSMSSTNKLRKLEEGVHELEKMTPEKRQALVTQWNYYMGLNEEEKNRILKTISEPERAQIEKTLQKFENLTPEQRATCVRSFVQFRNLSSKERQDFLKNAVKWSSMRPEERKQWQDLVEEAQLLPPDIRRAVPLPPKPPEAVVRFRPGGGKQIATNQ